MNTWNVSLNTPWNVKYRPGLGVKLELCRTNFDDGFFRHFDFSKRLHNLVGNCRYATVVEIIWKLS